MEIAFHCPNCLADLIYDESKKYTCLSLNEIFKMKIISNIHYLKYYYESRI